jgi:hypothetical protein
LQGLHPISSGLQSEFALQKGENANRLLWDEQGAIDEPVSLFADLRANSPHRSIELASEPPPLKPWETGYLSLCLSLSVLLSLGSVLLRRPAKFCPGCIR